MGRGKPEIRIGTSGWYYNHWLKKFYPDKLPKNKWFNYYTEHFDTVEINNTFYQLPKESTFTNWYKKAPKDFIYTVKANRFITHVKKLKNTIESLELFFERIHLLKEKLGPILYQLPPNFHKDLKILQSFVDLLPKNHINVFEFRHKSWLSPDTFELLNKFKQGFCIHDLSNSATPKIITGKIIYIRLHGSTGKYQGSYPNTFLKQLAKWIKENSRNADYVYVYLNNDFNAYAVYNAKQLKAELLRK